MIQRFLDQVLPRRRPLSRTARLGWMAFFVLGPLAYLGGSLLERQGTGRTAFTVSADRSLAIATGRQFLADRGIDATTWSAYASADPLPNLLEYYRMHRDRTAVAAQSFSLPVTVRVLLVSGAGDKAEVLLDRTGTVAGYDLTRVKSIRAAAPVDEATAAAVASGLVARIPNLASVLSLGKPEIGTLAGAPGGDVAIPGGKLTIQGGPGGGLDKPGSACRTFTWHSATAALPALTFDIGAAVCGAVPVRLLVKTELESAYAETHWLRQTKPLRLLLILYSLYIAIVLVYSIYRYARRSMEKEVSHARTVLLGGLISAALVADFLTAMDEYVFGFFSAGQDVLWFPLVAIFLGFLVVGFGVAIAYGAGEGDLRELHPGKMTSLDALLRGKLFSRNVARSALFGAAYAAWMLLPEGWAHWAFTGPAGSAMSGLMKLPFFRYPLIAIFAGQAIMVTLIPASGLLLPLAFLHRNVRRVQLRNGLLLMFAVLSCLINASRYGSIGSAIAGTAVLTATLIGPFLGMDFLAVIFSLAAFEIATSLARLVALSPSWLQLGISVGVIGLCFLAVEVWAALRGREYQDEEVRPLYARHMAERQLWQAEMAAAREAQLHLLPKGAPEIEGLSISAACIPARVVGGDFYDFFPLGENRLGIFIAEGGNRGIGSALNIALAKGFLMHTAPRNLSPREVILRLESVLGPLLAGAGASTHVAYAIIDTAVGQIRYARTGDYPRVTVSGSPSTEHRIDTIGTGNPLYEGSANLRAGDTVLLFTDGVARRVRTSGTRAAEGIQRALAGKLREHELEDDLTAVVVRVTRIGAAMEVVA